MDLLLCTAETARSIASAGCRYTDKIVTLHCYTDARGVLTMDLFKMASGMLGGRQADGPVGAIIGMLAQHPGGLSGLVSQFQNGGLGDLVNSWVSTGQNLPVSPGQLSGMFNSDQL